MTQDLVDFLRQSDSLRLLDCAFADFLSRRTKIHDPAVWAAAALLSHSTGQGHVCLDLPTVAGRTLPAAPGHPPAPTLPELAPWRTGLLAHPAVGRPGEALPLILDHEDRLYLHRYWTYEHSLATRLQQEAQAGSAPIDESILADGLKRLFGPSRDGEIDWQKLAACTAVLKRLCLITGGPGTGKTTTVARVLALLLEQPAPSPLRISLAAPTGKAAARLEEAIGQAKDGLACGDAVREAIPREATTLHRLLGASPGSPTYRHHADRPLPSDVVVVDEASMVDLALMAKLVDALPRGARLILLGDRNQLASVQAGAVLGDLCGFEAVKEPLNLLAPEVRRVTGLDSGERGEVSPGPAIRECIVELVKSHRFGTGSGIGALAGAINEGKASLAFEILEDERYPTVQWRSLPPTDQLRSALRGAVREGFEPFLGEATLPAMLQAFGRFRILCALRRGPYGVVALNAIVEHILREDGSIGPGTWYFGRPILITTNDHPLKLYNGDIGIVAPEAWPTSGDRADPRQDLRAHFLGSQGQPRCLPLPRLPEHETAYALTVHKSQGSEFDRVHLILPDRDARVLTRELLYTGVTRTRDGVVIWGRREVFERAVARRTLRSSGLRDALWDQVRAPRAVDPECEEILMDQGAV